MLGLRIRLEAVVLALGSSMLPHAFAADAHTVESNLEYRLALGGLGLPAGIKADALESNRAVRLSGDTNQFLQECRTDSKVWHTDPLWERLFHGSPRSTIG